VLVLRPPLNGINFRFVSCPRAIGVAKVTAEYTCAVTYAYSGSGLETPATALFLENTFENGFE